MQLLKPASAGTMDSCDINIRLEIGDTSINEVYLNSVVEKQFGKHIEALILSVLEKHHLEGVTVNAVDRGALDCTIEARVESAIMRGLNQEHVLEWSVIVNE